MMDDDPAIDDVPPRSPVVRIAAATALAAAFALGVYLLLNALRPSSGIIAFSFLLVLPAGISAFVAYVSDPWGRAGFNRYLMVPVYIVLAVCIMSLVVLREGVICVLLLAPLWLIAGLAGSGLTYVIRRRLRRGRHYCAALFVAPLLAMQVEPMLPLPATEAVVTRSAIIAAPAEAIWPLLEGIPDVKPGEGAWNLSQDVIGIPRPLGARLVGAGIGADRLANWGRRVRFRERITAWEPGRRIGWRFIFDDIEGWKFTDRHLMPDSAYLRVTRGGYTLAPIDAGHTRVTLDTHYWMKTPVNGYAALWGELFLGDLEDNLLALVKQRAESGPSVRRPVG